MSLTIGMILDNEFTGDMRVENQVYSLSKAGFNVLVLCLNHGGKPAKEDFQGAQIVRVTLSKYQKNKMKGLMNTIIDPYKYFWKKHITRFVKEYKINILHVHDLYMLSATYAANERLKSPLPVVADLHENFAAALRNYKYANTFPGKLIISIPKWERKEKEWTAKAHQVITVIEEAKERYSRLGVPQDKIHVVANYVNSDFFLDTNLENQELAERLKGRKVLLYTGGFDTHRGLEDVIRAIQIVKEDVPEICLVLVGTGANTDELKALSNELGVADHVMFEGWQAPQMLPAYMHYSTACLIPHLKTEHTDNTIPHKLFQYMLMKKPVIVTNCRPLERIVMETKSGLVYKSGDHVELSKQILAIVSDPKLTEQYGNNGMHAVKTKYNWGATAEALIRLYKGYSTK